MKEKDGIEISDRPTWALSYAELRTILAKRLIALPSKMIGFKPFCLFLATWLLVVGRIDMWIWFLVFVSVLFGIVGLKVATSVRGFGLREVRGERLFGSDREGAHLGGCGARGAPGVGASGESKTVRSERDGERGESA